MGIDKYIEQKYNVLSPSTIRGYRAIQKGRFREQMGKPVDAKIDWQSAVNEEALLCSPKTLKNSWRFIATILRTNGVQPPKVQLPLAVPNSREWLDYKQIKTFVAACVGKNCEIGALLALHSLRRSEIFALTWDDIDLENRRIRVRGAMVPDETHRFVIKETNKNLSSTRSVPIMIPELLTALVAVEPKEGAVIDYAPDTLRKRINRVCFDAGLPSVGIHGLRHSFASLGYHLKMSETEVMAIGGWSDYETIHKVYLHLANEDKMRAENKMAQFYSSK